MNLSELGTHSLPNFAELCQPNQSSIPQSSASILLYSPSLDPNSLSNPSSARLIAYHPLQVGHPNVSLESKAALDQLQTFPISLPNNTAKASDGKVATVQLANGLRLGISTNMATSPTNVMQMLALESLPDGTRATQSVDGLRWPLHVQTDAELSSHETPVASATSPKDLGDVRPSSVENSESGNIRGTRSSSASSVSSSSQANSSSNKVTSPGLKDMRLDPSEQSRMRLERKRARNRDAARKCRERKIRLIKSLEKDVLHLSEENKALRNRLSRSRVEVERLKVFVVNHLDKDCTAVSNKMVSVA